MTRLCPRADRAAKPPARSATSAYGEDLRPIRGWEVVWRGLYGIPWEGSVVVLEVDYFDITETVRLYQNGKLREVQKSPARFELAEGVAVEGAMALFGMKRAHLVVDGAAHAMRPLRGTGEECRLSWGRRHPVANAVLAAGAWLVLAAALVTQVPHAIAGAVHMVGLSFPTFDLPAWLNTALGVLGVAAGLDRGLRMKHNPLLDD